MKLFLKLFLLAALIATGCFAVPRHGGAGVKTSSPAPEPPEEPAWMAEVALPAGTLPPSAATRSAIAQAIAELSSKDFGVYAAAARRLVALGPATIPYLGCYGDLAPPGKQGQGLAIIVLGPIFETMSLQEVGVSLDSPYATVRAAAAEAAGEHRQAEHAQRLIHLLEDEHLGVRRAAITALRRISIRFYGYRPEDPPEVRAKAVSRWRELWGPG